MSSEYRTKLIRRAVDANTSPNVAATPLQARTLHKFFESPQCADTVYMKIIERGEWAVSGLTQPASNLGTMRGMGMTGTVSSGGGNTMDTLPSGLDGSSSGGTVTASALGKIGAFMGSVRGPGVGDGGDKVLMKCVRILKTYLLVYYPSDPVLIALDRFCFRMEAIFEDGAKSFEYVRALVDAISRSRHNHSYLTSSVNAPASSMLHNNPTSSSANGGAGIATAGGAAGAPSNSASSAAQINYLHFNTAPSGVLAGLGPLNAPGSTPLGTPHTGGASGTRSPPLSSGHSSPPHHRYSVSMSGLPSDPSTAAGRTSAALPALLTPNFIASRVRLQSHRHLPHLLNSLLCSSIFAGRVPKPLLDVLVEHVDPFYKSASHNVVGTVSAPPGTHSHASPFASPSTSNATHTGRSATGKTSGNVSATGASASTKDLPANAHLGATMGNHNVALGASSKPLHHHPARAFLFSLHDQDLRERIATVSSSKKLEERALYRTFRIGQPLFQYKHYAEQVKLDISASQIDVIVTAIIQSSNHESRLLASKILIKLIMDMYCQDSIETASAALLTILLELSAPEQLIDTKIHAFNLIFNLSTHLHMFEEVSFFGPPQASPASSSYSSLPGYSPLTGATPTTHRIQCELFSMVKELLLIQCQQGETNRKLWYSGLNCLLYFMTDAGFIETEKLQGLDVRVIAAFFKNLDYINDSIWRHLVRILVNRLYLDSNRSSKKAATMANHEFMAQVLLLGQKHGWGDGVAGSVISSNDKAGIRFIVELYKRSRSMEAQDNLFCVIFDYIHYCYRRMIRSTTPSAPSGNGSSRGESNQTVRPSSKANDSQGQGSNPNGAPSSAFLGSSSGAGPGSGEYPSRKYSTPSTSAQFSDILELLVRVDAPHYFASVFKYPPPNFVNHVLGLLVHVANSAPDGEMLALLNQTDPIILRRVLKDFASLAELTLRLSQPFSEDCAVLLSEPSNSALLNASLKSITSLIQGRASNDAGASKAIAYERLQGAQWMQQLMQIVWNVRLGLDTVALVESRNKSNPNNTAGLPIKARTRKDSASISGSSTISTTSLHSKHGRKSSRDHNIDAKEMMEKSPRASSSDHVKSETTKERSRDHGAKDSAKGEKEHHHQELGKSEKDGVSARDTKGDGKDPAHAKEHAVPKSEKGDKTEAASTGLAHHPHREVSPRREHSPRTGPSGSSGEPAQSGPIGASGTAAGRTKVNPVNLGVITSGLNVHGYGTAPTSPVSPKEAVPLHLLPTRGLHLRKADPNFVDAVEATFYSYVKSSDPIVRRSYLRIVESGMLYLMSLSDQGASPSLRSPQPSLVNAPAPNSTAASSSSNPISSSNRTPRLQSMLLDAEVLAKKSFELLNAAFLKLIKIGQETTEANLQLMFDMIVSFTMLVPLPHRSHMNLPRSSSTSFIDPLFSSKSRSSSGTAINAASQASLTSPREKLKLQAQTLKSPGRGEFHAQTYDQYHLSDSDESFGSAGDLVTWNGHGTLSPDLSTPPSPQLDRISHPTHVPDASSKAIDMMDLNSQDDSPAGLFMRGKVDVVRSLLENVHIDILLHLFKHLPPRMNSATRPVVLHFLTERCKHSASDLDAVGGSSFFKQLLTENDPLISYLASRFLIDKLQKEQPENFNMVVNTLLAKAVDLNDEKLVSNPYLQIKAIFEMNTTLRRKEHGSIFPL